MNDWYYSQGGQKQGPVSNAELKQLALSGQLKPTDQVWRDGMAGWVAAQTIRGLFGEKAGDVPDKPALAPKTATLNLLVDYLTFRRMITPIFIHIFFWVGSILFILIGLYLVVHGLIPQDRGIFGGGRKSSDFSEVFMGLLSLVFGPLSIRILCEFDILFFRINETLTEIKNNTELSTRNP